MMQPFCEQKSLKWFAMQFNGETSPRILVLATIFEASALISMGATVGEAGPL